MIGVFWYLPDIFSEWSQIVALLLKSDQVICVIERITLDWYNTSLFDDPYFTEEEVWVLFLWCPSHKLTEWQSPVKNRAPYKSEEDYWFWCVCVCVLERKRERAHLYTKFLCRKSIWGTVDTWIFTSLSPPICPRYSSVHFSRQGPRHTPLSMAGLRWKRTLTVQLLATDSILYSLLQIYITLMTSPGLFLLGVRDTDKLRVQHQ